MNRATRGSASAARWTGTCAARRSSSSRSWMLCSMNSRRSTTLPSTQLTPPPLLSRSHTILPPEIPVFTSYSSTYYDTIIALHPEIDIRSTHPKPYSFYSFSPHLLPPTLYDSRRTNARIPRAIYQKTALGKKTGGQNGRSNNELFVFSMYSATFPIHTSIYTCRVGRAFWDWR